VKYRTIVADPPWPYPDGAFKKPLVTGHSQSRKRDPDFAVQGKFSKRSMPFDGMSIDELKTIPVATLADESGCRLFLWTTNAYLPVSFSVLIAWGFTYGQTLVWHKANPLPLPSHVAPNSAEFIVVGRMGRPGRTGAFPSAVIHQAVQKGHSRKPEIFLDYIEQVSPGPYVELFARRHRLGWDVWGNESANTAELGPVA